MREALSQSYGRSPAIWDHTVLHATRGQQWRTQDFSTEGVEAPRGLGCGPLPTGERSGERPRQFFSIFG